MADFPYLTKTEKIVMRIFWHADKPLTHVFEVLHDNEIEEFLAAFTAKKEEKEKSLH